MDAQTIKKLVKKASLGKISPKEKLLVLKELNAAIEGMRHDLAVLKDDSAVNKARKSL